MEIKIDKSFRKDTKKIKNKALLKKIAEAIIQVRVANKLEDILNQSKALLNG